MVAVCICTYQRQGELSRLLRFLTNTKLPDGCEIFVIDNDATRSAEPIAQEYGVVYAVEPKRGYASVRNTALRTAFSRGHDRAAFLDDDDLPDKDWLVRLLEHDADRSTLIIALGGGVVGDMAGLAAATGMVTGAPGANR